MIKTEEKTYPIMVSIRCATYNHVKYIRKCLEGFVMQITTFPFEAIVHDDASTDGTTEILREYAEKYPNIIKPLYEEENLWSKQNGSLTKRLNEGLRGKYIAICDGDDYWMDPYKLQKQVDYLENHQEYTLVHTAFSYIDIHGDKIPTPPIPLYQNMERNIRDGFVWHFHLTHSTFILYSTVMYRSGLLDSEVIGADHGLFMSCSRQGKIYYIPDNTTMYRIDANSMMRKRQSVVGVAIRNDILRQLYYFCSSKHNTVSFYKFNLKSRIAIGEGIISSIVHFSKIKVDDKRKIIVHILFSRPLNILMLPIALFKKVLRRVK